MSLSVNLTNYPPAFGSSKALSKVKQFAKNQYNHIFCQVGFWGIMETANPSLNLKSALFQKLTVDFLEVTANFMIKYLDPFVPLIKGTPEPLLTAGKQCTNVFAYIADAGRSLGKAVKKITTKPV